VHSAVNVDQTCSAISVGLDRHNKITCYGLHACMFIIKGRSFIIIYFIYKICHVDMLLQMTHLNV